MSFNLLPSTSMSSQTFTIEPHMSRRPPFTVEAPGCPSIPGETIPRRNARYPDRLLSRPEDSISTVFDIVQHSARKFGDRNAMGSRKLIKKHTEIKRTKKIVDGELQDVDKTWIYFELSSYTYLSFRQHETVALQLGAGLRKLGLVASDRLHLFASTR
jgi:long-chain acyl-CoA synthetase